jgi:hypothetical protein
MLIVISSIIKRKLFSILFGNITAITKDIKEKKGDNTVIATLNPSLAFEFNNLI